MSFHINIMNDVFLILFLIIIIQQSCDAINQHLQPILFYDDFISYHIILFFRLFVIAANINPKALWFSMLASYAAPCPLGSLADACASLSQVCLVCMSGTDWSTPMLMCRWCCYCAKAAKIYFFIIIIIIIINLNYYIF